MTSSALVRLLQEFRVARPGWWGLAKIGAWSAALAGVVLLIRDRLPPAAGIWSDLMQADGLWVMATLGLQGWSIGLVSHQQRRLLRAFGVPMTGTRMQAVTYASAAVALTVPAGGLVSGGYAFRQYRAGGADAGVAAAVMVLSGLLSTVGLVLVGGGAFAVAAIVRFWPAQPFLVSSIGVAVVGLALGAWRWQATRLRPTVTSESATPRMDVLQVRHPRLGQIARPALGAVRLTRQIRGRDLRDIVLVSAGKWLLDAACLMASCQAIGIDVAPAPMILMYLGVQVVRQIPLTPGGAGLVEAALLAGLLAAGAAQAPAAAAVLIYRLASAWLVVPIGAVAMLVLRRTVSTGPAGEQPRIDAPAG